MEQCPDPKADQTRVSRYELECCIEEIRFLKERNKGIEACPDVFELLGSAPAVFLFQQIQNLIWTMRRVVRPAALRRTRAKAPAARRRPGGEPGEILLDITAAHRGLPVGGIRRLSLQFARTANRLGTAVPVYIEDGLLRAWPSAEIVEAGANDTYVVVSLFWSPRDEYAALIRALKNRGVRIVTMVHDVIPALWPGLNPSPFARAFRDLLPRINEESDALVTLSRASASDIASYFAMHHPHHALSPIDVVPMGADAVDDTGGSLAREKGRFLTVGSLLPHKGVPVALAAFELLWKRDLDVHYTIIGREDETMGFVADAIRNHPELGRRLSWLSDASDDDLKRAYGGCACYLQPSISEGFGIPLVEAARFGASIIASDIPVFREIAGAQVRYFKVCDADDLARVLEESLSLPPILPHFRTSTWEESLEALCRVCRRDPAHVQARLDPQLLDLAPR